MHTNACYCADLGGAGKVQKLSYYLFIDAECTRPIKRIVHNIYDAVPNYGLCVAASVGGVDDKRATLTVCHNEDSASDGALPAP
jgi:hypothetical protein